MSSNPLKPSFRYPAALPAGVAHDSVVKAIQNNVNGLVDVNQALVALTNRVNAIKGATSNVMAASGGSSSIVINGSTFQGLGGTNDQTGVTTYALVAHDNGILLILNDASPVAVSLNSGLATPYFLFITNKGSGAVTLTPSSGLVNGAASLVMTQHETLMAVFDGTNWLTSDLLVLAQTFTAVTHEFLTAYDAATGAFSAAQPAIADVSGLAAALALLAPIASPTFTGTVTQPDATVLTAATTTTSATAGAGTALPATPEGYLSVSINGTIYKMPYFNV